MDLITMLYYATVCALLSVGTGRTRRWTVRLGVGAAVGIVAAAALPTVRAAIGV